MPHEIKKYATQSPQQPEYTQHKRHVFIMTSGGKPVYVRYGDEIDLASFLATLAAIMEKFSMYFSTDKQKSSFQKVVQNNYTILFI